jgi:hypothetical protein
MPDPDRPRLIEIAFPLKQASLDSVREKNVRHGAHLDAAHLAGEAAAGGVPGGAHRHAVARSGDAREAEGTA